MADASDKRNTQFTFINKDARNVAASHAPAVNSHTATVMHERRRLQHKKRHERRLKEFFTKYIQRSDTWSSTSITLDGQNAPRSIPVAHKPAGEDRQLVEHLASISTSTSFKTKALSLKASEGYSPRSPPLDGLQTFSARDYDVQGLAYKTKSQHNVLYWNLLQRRTTSVTQPMGTTLDTVVHLPYELSDHDRFLFRFFLSELQSEELDTNATSPAVRYGVFRTAISYGLQMRWFLIAAEARFAYRKKQQPANLFARKAEIYRLMNSALQDPAQSCTDEVIMAVIGAVAIEFRYYGPESIQMHTRALEDMIRRRGGFAAFAAKTDVLPVLMFLFWPFHACSRLTIVDHYALEQLIESFSVSLREMQRWHRDHKRKPHLKRSEEQNKLLSEYLHLCRRAFNSTHGILTPYITTFHPYQNWVEQQCHFSILFNLNLVLSGFQSDLHGATQFLSTFLRDFERAYSTKKAPPPTTEPIMYTLLYATLQVDQDRARRVGGVHGEQKEGGYAPWQTWKLTEAFKVKQLLEEDKRQKVLDVMSTWLIRSGEDDDGGNELVEVSDRELEEMKEEVRRNWWEQQGRGRGR